MRRQIKTKELRMRFPNSRELFLFTRRVVMEESGIKDVELISDIEIGRLIDYDYKYTHQWKFGKKNVHDIVELTHLSRNLGVDLGLLTRLTLGEIKSEPAFKAWKEARHAPTNQDQRTPDALPQFARTVPVHPPRDHGRERHQGCRAHQRH